MRARQTFSTLACSLLVGSAVLAGTAAPAANATEINTNTATEATASATTTSVAAIKIASIKSLPTEASIKAASAADRAALAAKIDAVIDSNSKALQQLEAAALEGMNAETNTAAAAEKANKDFEEKSAQIDAVNKSAYAKLALANGTTISAEQKRSEARLAAAADAELELATTQAPIAADTSISPLADPFGTQTTEAGAQGASLGSTATAGTALPAALSKYYASSWATKVANNNYYLYKYGYIGPRYFDCSGFTKTAMAKSQISIPRTSTYQYRGSRTKVSLSNLRVGDLIFWTSNGGYSFYHVAMYIGNGNIVHARNPTSGISVTKMNYAGMTNIYRYGVRY